MNAESANDQIVASIIIPVFNQSSYTANCLESLYKFSARSSFEVIVIDNASSDDTPETLSAYKKKYSNFKVISNTKNQGYSLANGQGAAISDGKFLIFLNNDTLVTENWLDALIRPFENSEIGLVGAKLLYPDDETINHAGYVYNQTLKVFYPIYHGANADFINRRREFQAVLGACMAIPKDLFYKLGQFATYGLEDIDLCLKVRESGLKVIVEPESVVYHFGSVTLKNSSSDSFEQTDINGFNVRWPDTSFFKSDLPYYQEDGIEIAINNAEDISLIDLKNLAMEEIESGMSAFDNQEYAKAEIHFRKAVNFDSKLLGAYGFLAETLIRSGQSEEAYNVCTKLLQKDPENALGQALMKILKKEL